MLASVTIADSWEPSNVDRILEDAAVTGTAVD